MNAVLTSLLLVSVEANVESELRNYLLKDYNKDVLPSASTREPTFLSISFNLFRLYQVEQTMEIIDYSAEFAVEWIDPALQWDQNQFNRAYIKLKEGRVWTPQLSIPMSVSVDYGVDPDNRYLVVLPNGTVRQSIYGVFGTQCKLEVYEFPFDLQSCQINIGPWFHRINEVDINQVAIGRNSSFFQGNSEWEVGVSDASVSVQTDDDVKFTYRSACFTVTLRRHSEWYVWTFLVPTFIVAVIAIFGIFAPTNHYGARHEKTSLTLTTLFSTAVMLRSVSSTMPHATKIPVLGDFLFVEILIISSAGLASIIIHRLHYLTLCKKWKPPSCLDGVLQYDRAQWRGEQKKKREEEGVNRFLEDLHRILEEIHAKSVGRLADKERVAAWDRLFSYIDLICLLLFQLAHVICTLLLVVL